MYSRRGGRKHYTKKMSERTWWFLCLHPWFSRIKVAALDKNWFTKGEVFNEHALNLFGTDFQGVSTLKESYHLRCNMKVTSWIDFILGKDGSFQITKEDWIYSDVE